MEWVAAVVALLVGAALGFLLGKQKLAGAVARSEHDALAAEKAALAALLEEVRGQLSGLEGDKKALQQELTEGREKLVRAQAQSEEQQKRLTEQKAELETMQKQMEVKFQNLSQQMLEQMGKKFSTESEEKLDVLLKPMKERLGEFSKLVVESFSEQAKEQRSLQNEIQRIVTGADSLSKALRGDVKAQGNWGEVVLERILEQSGLVKGQDYTVQGEDMKLAAEDGSRQKPDVIIHLPEERHLIVDSKVSLTAYDRYCSADEAGKAAHLKDFITSIRAHVVGLAGKDYSGNSKLASPDFVMLFMPIEGAFSLAMQHDPELHAFAWNKRIALVCPTTLFASLKTVASLWRIEKQNRNAEKIAQMGADLYDKLAGFVEDMQGIGKQLDAAKTKYDGAMNKLSTGTGNLIKRAEDMRKEGLKTKKALPKSLTLDEEDAPALLEEAK